MTPVRPMRPALVQPLPDPRSKAPMEQPNQDARIEAAAEAIWRGHTPTGMPWWALRPQTREDYRKLAAEALAAADKADPLPDPRVEVLAKALFGGGPRGRWKSAKRSVQEHYRSQATAGLAALDKAASK